MTSSLDNRLFLKVKLKTLAAEARIIRFHEQRARGQLRERLRAHRVQPVRSEAHATHLAYGFIRGRARFRIEPNRRTLQPPAEAALWARVESMVKKYGAPGAYERLKPWREIRGEQQDA